MKEKIIIKKMCTDAKLLICSVYCDTCFIANERLHKCVFISHFCEFSIIYYYVM